MIRRRAALLLVGVTALAGAAAGCGSDDSGSNESITVPSIATATDTPATTVPDDQTLPTNGTDTTPDVVTTPPPTTPQKGTQNNGNGGSSAEQNFNNYCKQYPGACGD